MLMLSKCGINCSSKLEILSKLQVYESIGPQLLGALIYTLQLGIEKTVAEGEWIHEVLKRCNASAKLQGSLLFPKITENRDPC